MRAIVFDPDAPRKFALADVIGAMLGRRVAGKVALIVS